MASQSQLSLSSIMVRVRRQNSEVETVPLGNYIIFVTCVSSVSSMQTMSSRGSSQTIFPPGAKR